MKNKQLLRITVTAMMIALCYIGANFIKFDIVLPIGATKFHLGNTFCILAALLLGGVNGGLAGGLGMMLGDLFDPLYIASAPKTFILKFIIGYLAGTFFHNVFKLDNKDTKNRILKIYLCAAIPAFLNVLVEPCVSWLYYSFILNMADKAATVFAGAKLLTTLVNAILATAIAPTLYIAISSRMSSNLLKDLVH